MQTPIPLIYATLENFERFHQTGSNMQALVHARGWGALMSSSFLGSGEPINPIDLLPYPDAVKGHEKKPNRLTIRVLVKLIKQRRLPAHVSADAEGIDQVSELLDKEGFSWLTAEQN